MRRPYLALGMILALSACTIRPRAVTVDVAPYHGNIQFVPVKLPDGGWQIDQTDLANYNALIELGYGKLCFPVPARNDGVTFHADGTLEMTAQRMGDLATMARAHRSGQAPP